MGLRGWIVRGLLATFVVPGAFLTASVFGGLLGSGRVADLAAIGLLAAVLIGLSINDCRHAKHWWVALLFGAYMGVLTFLSVWLGPGIHIAVDDGHAGPHLVGTVWVVCYALSYLFVWRIVQTVSGPIVVQDGTLCPDCGYSLVGCTREVCPECGRPFSYQEMGTSKEEMRRRMQDPVG